MRLIFPQDSSISFSGRDKFYHLYIQRQIGRRPANRHRLSSEKQTGQHDEPKPKARDPQKAQCTNLKRARTVRQQQRAPSPFRRCCRGLSYSRSPFLHCQLLARSSPSPVRHRYLSRCLLCPFRLRENSLFAIPSRVW
jgi:hypothetical protein